MELIKPKYRDEKELKEFLNKFIGKLEATVVGYDEELMARTLVESERREKEFVELMQNPDEFHKVIDLIDKKSIYEEFLTELKDALYIGYEEIKVDTTNSFLTSKTTPRFRKQSESADWLAKHVKPYILTRESRECRRNYIAEMEGVSPQTITNRMKQVFGEETDWKTYVEKVLNGDY